MGDTSKNVEEYLKDFKIKDAVTGQQEIFSIPSSSTVEDGLKELAQRKILSLPVLDKKTNKYIGIVSISDIVIAICFNPCFSKVSKGGDSMEKLTKKDLKDILKKSVLKNPIQDVLGMTEEGKNLWVFQESEDMVKLAEYFSQGVHRALVVREGKGPCFVTQSDVVKFLASKTKADNSLAIAELLKKPLSELGHVENEKKVVTVTDNETALTGFRRLLQWQSFRDWNLAALPVVDSKTGKIVGNLSESDLRGLNHDRLLDVLFTVPAYLKTFYGEMRKPETVVATATFGEAIDKIIASEVHRLWIVDADEKPIGVFSLSDIISQFTTFSWSHMKAMDKMFE
mmetsp:Transcript_897/g.1713  ORF Transcript_897/g.1713 Transcript_897/m.1713 type:complete len:341 (-) Transcript_897:289-1311(-)